MSHCARMPIINEELATPDFWDVSSCSLFTHISRITLLPWSRKPCFLPPTRRCKTEGMIQKNLSKEPPPEATLGTFVTGSITVATRVPRPGQKLEIRPGWPPTPVPEHMVAHLFYIPLVFDVKWFSVPNICCNNNAPNATRDNEFANKRTQRTKKVIPNVC